MRLVSATRVSDFFLRGYFLDVSWCKSGLLPWTADRTVRGRNAFFMFPVLRKRKGGWVYMGWVWVRGKSLSMLRVAFSSRVLSCLVLYDFSCRVTPGRTAGELERGWAFGFSL